MSVFIISLKKRLKLTKTFFPTKIFKFFAFYCYFWHLTKISRPTFLFWLIMADLFQTYKEFTFEEEDSKMNGRS